MDNEKEKRDFDSESKRVDMLLDYLRDLIDEHCTAAIQSKDSIGVYTYDLNQAAYGILDAMTAIRKGIRDQIERTQNKEEKNG